jgi:replicative DNA helicase
MNQNTEYGLLSGIMISAENGSPVLADYLSRGLNAEWFSDHRCKLCFEAVQACESEKPGSSTVNRVAEKAIDLGLDMTGDFLKEVRWSEASAAWSEEYFNNLRKVYVRGQQANAIADFCRHEIDAATTAESWPDKLEVLIQRIRGHEGAGSREADTGLRDAIESYKEGLSESAKAKLVKTHIFDLNDALGGGLRPNQLVVCCGRPGMGKSAFAMEICEYGCGEGAGLYYSLEMSLQDFGERLAHRFKGDMRKTEEYARSNGMILRTKGQWTVEKIRADAISTRDRLRSEGRELKLVCVDHIGLVAPSAGQHKRTREQEVAHISRNLKVLAGELEAPVIAVSQLNRGVEFRSEKGPVLSDLRDSGAIEQDSDIVLGLHRPGYYDENMKHFVDEIRCLKVRQGRTGTVPANFVADRVCWRGA